MSKPFVLLAVFFLVFASTSRADVVVTESDDGCESFRAVGTTSAPWVRLEVFDGPTSIALQDSEVIGGAFERAIEFPKREQGTELTYVARGMVGPIMPGVGDGQPHYEETLHCDGMPKAMRKCSKAYHSNWKRLHKYALSDTAKCLKTTAAGKTALDECIWRLDPKDKDKFTPLEQGMYAIEDSAECQLGAPVVGLQDPNSASLSTFSPLFTFVEVFGVDTPGESIAQKATDKQGAKCQAAANKMIGALTKLVGDRVEKAAQRSIAGSGPLDPAQTEEEFEEALNDALDATPPLFERTWGKHRTKLLKACEADDVVLFPGCDDATDVGELAACIGDFSWAGTCNILEGGYHIDLGCDL